MLLGQDSLTINGPLAQINTVPSSVAAFLPTYPQIWLKLPFCFGLVPLVWQMDMSMFTHVERLTSKEWDQFSSNTPAEFPATISVTQRKWPSKFRIAVHNIHLYQCCDLGHFFTSGLTIVFQSVALSDLYACAE